MKYIYLLFFIVFTLPAAANKPPIKIYLDADRSVHTASAKSIEMGIKTAFAEIDNMIQGRKIEFVALDHRGNSTRSKLNMKKAFQDPNTLFVLGGLHSPPLIKNRKLINENKMLTLVPWAAGGPITRSKSSDNWIFRLSVDDTKAGYRIAGYATQQDQCKNPHLFLEKTPWGQSNKNNMTKAIEKNLKKTPEVEWFNWGISEENARIKLRSIQRAGADCILFVGNANDGAVIMQGMAHLQPKNRLPIYSHWGITGGNFHEKVSQHTRDKIKLKFIQSCFSFVSSKPTSLSRNVFAKAQKLFPHLKNEKSLQAPPGFIHAYDIGRLVIEAMKQVKTENDMSKTRDHLRLALEDLQSPVKGLVKTYKKPFSSYNAKNQDAHEALTLQDLCMAHYGKNNEIIVLPNK